MIATALALITALMGPPKPAPATVDVNLLQHATFVCRAAYDVEAAKVQLACAVLSPEGEVLAVDGASGPVGPLGNIDAALPLKVWGDALATLLAPLTVPVQQATK